MVFLNTGKFSLVDTVIIIRLSINICWKHFHSVRLFSFSPVSELGPTELVDWVGNPAGSYALPSFSLGCCNANSVSLNRQKKYLLWHQQSRHISLPYVRTYIYIFEITGYFQKGSEVCTMEKNQKFWGPLSIFFFNLENCGKIHIT